MHLPIPQSFLLTTTAVACASGFHMVGSTWTQKTPGSAASTYTAFRYDNSGNRIRETVFAPDSAGRIAGESFFEYDAKGRLSRTVVLSGSDTNSIAELSRDPQGRVVASRVTGKGGVLKYLDSSSYLGGQLARSWRLSGQGKLVSEHRFDSLSGAWRSDTLLAVDANDRLSATSITVSALDGSGRVGTETHWQCDASRCLQASTRRMAYLGVLLENVVGLEGDGTGHVMTDSVHYGYDLHENRISEDWFDAEGLPSQSWSFTWLADPVSWLDRGIRRETQPQANGRRISLPAGTSQVVLRDPSGRPRWCRSVPGESVVELPASLQAGFYLASFAGTSGNRTIRLLIGN